MTKLMTRRTIHPVKTFDRTFRDMDRLFNGLFGQPAGLERQDWVPAVDVREDESAFNFVVELPGLTKEDVEVTFEDRILTLSGERRWEEDEQQNNYRRIERSYGSFSRAFTLPRSIQADKIEANVENGLLTVVVPKAPEARPQKIEIH